MRCPSGARVLSQIRIVAGPIPGELPKEVISSLSWLKVSIFNFFEEAALRNECGIMPAISPTGNGRRTQTTCRVRLASMALNSR